MLALSESRAPLHGREAELQLLTGLLDKVERAGTAQHKIASARRDTTLRLLDLL